MTDPLQYLFAVLLLLAVPGPTNTMLAVAGATSDGKGLFRSIIASVAGYAVMITFARLVLLPLIAAYPLIGAALKLVVAAYLIYAAFKLWRAPIDVADARGQVSAGRIFTTTLINPKGLVFALSIIPQDHPLLPAYLAAFAGLALLTGGTWFLVGRGLARVSGTRAAALPRVGAVALAGFAVYIAWTAAG
jgi:threonine/homoserine/homoserine lactone efflux protein